MFPSLIMELCKSVKVEKYPRGNWIYPETPIYPLKIRGEGASSKSKKRKIDLGKSTDDDIYSLQAIHSRAILGVLK